MSQTRSRSLTLHLTLWFALASVFVLFLLGLLIGRSVEQHFEEQDIEARRKTIQVARQVWRDADKEHAGVIVTIGRDGALEVIRGLVRQSDRRADKSVARGEPARKPPARCRCSCCAPAMQRP